MNTAADKGALYTAAKPAPAAQAIIKARLSLVRLLCFTSVLIIQALASRGATSRPSGEPAPTVIICKVA